MQTHGEQQMKTTAELQSAVLEGWIAREREYRVEMEFETTAALELFETALKDAANGKAMDLAEIDEFGLKYYNATVEDLYGDMDGSDELEELLAATL
jgi:malate/lactate dehydrogenase